MRALLTGTLASAALAVAAGCAGEDDRLSREELVSEADAICVEHEGRLDELAEPESLADFERLVQDAKPIVEEGTEELRRLEPPEELESEYEEWMSRNEANLDLIDDLATAVAERDEQRIEEVVQELGRNEEEADELAAAIGLEACASE